MKTNDELIKDFFDAVSRKDIPALEQLIKEDANIINLKEKRGKKGTALHHAVDWLYLELAQWLIEHNADLEATDGYGHTPLHELAYSSYRDEAPKKQKRMEMLQLLISCGANIQTKDTSGLTALHIAATWSQFEIFKYILDRCNVADINAKNDVGDTPLCEVVSMAGNKLERVKLLVQKGADITVTNNNGQALLHYASGDSNGVIVELIKYLVLQCHLDIHKKDNMGQTPFHYAAKTGSVGTLKFLIDQGASIDETDNEGQTALHLAVGKRYNKDCVKARVELLISTGAKNDMQDKQGQTPLHVAVLRGLSDTVRYLLDTNIGIDIKDNHGLTAAMYAEFRFKLHEPTSEIYDFFDSIQDTHMKKSLFKALPKPASSRDCSFFRSPEERKEMFNLFKNTEKIRCDEIQSNQRCQQGSRLTPNKNL